MEKKSWCWERLKAGGEGDDRGWDGEMASPTQDMSLSKLQDLMDREAWHAAEVAKSRLSDWTELKCDWWSLVLWGVKVKVLITQSCPTLCDTMDCKACQAFLPMEFSRQAYYSVLPFPSPGDLPDSGIELGSPALQVFPNSSVSKESACNAGDLGSVPELGRSSGEGNGNPLQHSCLEDPMDKGA